MGFEEATHIEVDVGIPRLYHRNSSTLQEVIDPSQVLITEDLVLKDQVLKITRVTMGNPHCILLVDNFEFDYRDLGKQVSHFYVLL